MMQIFPRTKIGVMWGIGTCIYSLVRYNKHLKIPYSISDFMHMDAFFGQMSSGLGSNEVDR